MESILQVPIVAGRGNCLSLLLLLLLLPPALPAQNPALVPDYEADLRAAATDSARAMALQYLAFNLAHSEPERSIRHGEEALRIARQTENPWLLAQCQNGVGWAYFCRRDFARARTLLDSAIVYMRATNDYLDLASACNNQGWVCLKQGDNVGALQYFRDGLNAAEASGDQGRIAFMNRSLGAFYNAQKEFDKCIPHVQRASEQFEELRDTAQMTDCLITLGNAYSGLERYEQAIDAYRKAWPAARLIGDPLKEGMLLENWGMALSARRQFAAAFDKFESARRLIEPLDERVELAYLHYTIGSTYLLKGDTMQGIPALEKARALAAELQLADILGEALPVLHRAYAAIGWPDKAYQVLLAYQTLRDTLAAEARQTDLQRLQTEFETERTEKDLQIKTLANKRLQYQFWLAVAGFALAILAGLGAWYRARQRRRTNAALEAKNAEVLAQKAEAEALRLRAEQSEAAKERFLAAMSHEIRTPMNAIVGLSQLLDTGRYPDPTLARNISIIRQSGEHLMTILNDVLDLAKIEAQKFELRPHPAALAALLGLVRDTFAQRAAEKNLDLRLEAAPDLPPAVLVDAVRLGQVLNNLVSNAVKFTAAGEVVLAAARAPGGAIRFSVRDTGVGIAPDQQALVFEEYSQADAGVARTYGGTGLGLSIARGLVAAMGGVLELRSEPGRGSEFFFTVPLPETAADAVTTFAGAGTEIPRLACARPVRVLLIEDNLFNQAVAAQTIAAICPEIELTMTETGEQALEYAARERFDLILTDLQMPGIDGYETTRRLRAAGITVPIVALTASAVRTDEAKCLAAGMQEMLLKPVAPNELAAMLLRHVPATPVDKPVDRPTPLQDQPGDRKPAASGEAAGFANTALLRYAGGNPETARQLLDIIRTELAGHLPAVGTLREQADARAIRRRVHKMRPQFQVLGLTEHTGLLESIDHAETADAAFWQQVSAFEAVLADVVARLSTEDGR